MKKSNKKEDLIKIFSMLLIVILVLNLVLVFVLKYSWYVFWGIIILIGIISYLLKKFCLK